MSDEPKEPQPKPVVVADNIPTWLKTILVVLPILAFVVSLFSLFISFRTSQFSLGYRRGYQDHDVVAKVLGMSAIPKGTSSIVTNGEVFVDLALINNGNQREIIREAFLCYAPSNDFEHLVSWQRDTAPLNLQLDRGERRALHLLNPFNAANTGRPMWLGVAVRAIAPEGDDIQVVWGVAAIELAPDGDGARYTYDKNKTPRMQIISNERLPHQKTTPDGF